MFDQDISDADKIDRTYRMLLAQRRSKWFGVIIKILIIWGLYYGYQYLQQPEQAELKARIMQEAKTKILGFITPIVQDLVGDVLKNMQVAPWASPTDATGNPEVSAVPQPEITPEMIEAVWNSMKK